MNKETCDLMIDYNMGKKCQQCDIFIAKGHCFSLYSVCVLNFKTECSNSHNRDFISPD
jgi:hypothetical protein